MDKRILLGLALVCMVVGMGIGTFVSGHFFVRGEEGEEIGEIEEVPIPAVTPFVTVTAAPTATPSPTLTQTPTKKPTAVPTLAPTETPTPLPSATPTSDPGATDIHGLTERFAAHYGVDANTLRHIAKCESGFNPYARNLSYGGLYQFSPGAWARYRARMGEDANEELRFNAEAAVKTAAYVLSVNEQYIWPSCLP